MQIKYEIVGDLTAALASEVRAGERAVKGAIGAAATRLKTDWRGQVTGAGLGRRLGNTIRSAVYPKGQPSLNAAGIVYSKAPQIISPHAKGAVIRARSGHFLAIPTDAAPKGRRGGRITPAEFEQRTGQTLKFIFRRGRPSLLVSDGRLSRGKKSAGSFRVSRSKTGRGLTSVPIFVLVPQVRLSKRIDLDGPTRLAATAIPGDITARWQAAVTR